MVSILIVDDEPVLLDMSTTYIKRIGNYDIDTADSALTALEMLQERYYDVIVSDYEMPVMNGITFLIEIRSRGIDIPFIIFTGRGREEVAIDAINNGADYYLQKGGNNKAQFAELVNFINKTVEQNRAKKELVASEKRYRAVVECQTELISRFLPDGTHVFANEAFCRYYGIPYEELMGLKFTPNIPREDNQKLFSHFSQLTPENPFNFIEHRIEMPDGSVRWQEWSDLAVFDENGTILEYQSVGRDITDKKELEISIKENLNYVKALMDTIPAPVFYRDTKGIYKDCNKAFEELVAMSKEEILGKTIHDFFPQNLADHYRYKDDLIIRNPHVQQYEYTITDANGKELDVLFSKTALLKADGTVGGIVGVILDISERKEIEKKLNENFNYVKALMDSMAAPVFLRDVNGVYEDCNRAFEELVGMKKEEILGKTIHDFFPKELADHYRIKDDLIIADPHVQQYEYKITNAAGEEFDVMFSKTALLKADGTVGGIVGVIFDISERKRAEEEVKEKLNYVKALMDTMAAPVFLRDVNGVYEDCNKAFEELVGMKKEEILGKTIHDFFPKELADHYRLMDDLIIRNPYVQQYEHKITNAAGGEFDVMFSKTALLKADGTVGGIVGVIFDISKRIELEKALAESAEKYQTLAEFTYDWESWIGPDGSYIYISPSCMRISGYSIEEFMHDTHLIIDITHPVDQEKIRDHYQSIGAADDVIHHIDYRIITKSGEERWISHYCQPVFRQDGTYLGRRENKRDISQRKLVEAALQRANQKLNLLSGITRHDVLNQLTVLASYADLAKESITSIEAYKYLDRIRASIETITNQISFTRIYQDVGLHVATWQDVEKLIEQARSSIHIQNVTISNTIKDLELYADPLLEKVFYTLLDNSERHGQCVTHASFDVHKKQDGIEFTYEDNGVGIPEAIKEKIFESGFGQNTGYGLFLCQEILGISGYSIKEVGIPGKGAKFEIFIPNGMFRFKSR